MATANANSSFTSELFSFNLYKRNQGRVTRQLTAIGAGLIIVMGCWTLSQGPLAGNSPMVSRGIPMILAAIGCWACFRAVHVPRVADFLISVEAEMDKVTWATKEQLKRATIVVIVTMFFLGITLLAYDIFWAWFFTLIRVLKPVS